jgi:hypothetical protein
VVASRKMVIAFKKGTVGLIGFLIVKCGLDSVMVVSIRGIKFPGRMSLQKRNK